MNRYFDKTWRRTLRRATRLLPASRLTDLGHALQRSWAKGLSEAADAMDALRQAGEEDHSPRGTTPTHESAHEPLHEPASGFFDGSYSNDAGTRAYKLYVPPGKASAPRPLIVMLHGCGQNPDDFALGTRANEQAAELQALVLYPAQAQTANAHRCWNWFQPADQQRGQGEPSLIAEMTRHVAVTHDVDPRRVYVAGLSAGGAMAMTMASTYPDLYAAAGVHSGLPHGAAHDLMSALAAMRQGPARAAPEGGVFLPTIVFHGDDDSTVHPCNGQEIVERFQAISSNGQIDWITEEAREPRIIAGKVPDGQSFTRTEYPDAEGRVLIEHWLVHGAGHAWSGGDAAGSYTDPQGPDATREMFRFFMSHPQRARH